MKRISLISLTLIATLSGRCSSPSDQSPPEQQVAPRKSVSQALTGVSLTESPVGETLASHRREPGHRPRVSDSALRGSQCLGGRRDAGGAGAGVSDRSKGWQVDPERNQPRRRAWR